jgi:hypothetical protein
MCKCAQVQKGVWIDAEVDPACRRLWRNSSLDSYEREALLGWIRRWMEDAARPQTPPLFRGDIASGVMADLGLENVPNGAVLAWRLCETAGWSS